MKAFMLLMLLFLFQNQSFSLSWQNGCEKEKGLSLGVKQGGWLEDHTEEDEPAQVYTPQITQRAERGVSNPDSETIWVHGSLIPVISWTDLDGRYCKLELYKGETLIEELTGWLDGVSDHDILKTVDSAWGSGTDFRIRVYDNLGNEHWSDFFRISSTVVVTSPGTYTAVSLGSTDLEIAWSGCQGSEVKCELYRGSEYVDEITGWIPNNGNCTVTSPAPSRWGTGSGYSVKVIDRNGNFGFSSSFDIGSLLVQSFPGDTLPEILSWTGGNVVARIELYSGNDLIADLSGPVDNSGSFDLSVLDPYRSFYREPLRIKVTDDLDNYGWSITFDLSPIVSLGPVSDMRFVTIPSGSFQMGSPSTESGREENEKQHLVTVGSFELMTTEVTQNMWEEVMGEDINYLRNEANPDWPLRGDGDNYPVYYVSWNDCQEFIERLNELDPSHTYRLPSESEWEYACRAGTTTRFYWGDSDSESTMGRYCWYDENSNSSTHPVARKEPNAWGLYDMSGNVYEWCEDKYTSDYDDCPTDGRAYTGSGSSRVFRGGSWRGSAGLCRSANRCNNSPGNRYDHLGFRVARSV